MQLGHLDLEGCAETASAFGYTIFALQCPECADGMMADCYAGSGVLLGTGVYTLKPDSECKAEAWNPSAYGDTFTYNGGSYRNAVYTFSPSPTTATPGPTPAPTIPGSSPSLTYVGCFQDDVSRALKVEVGNLDLEGCAEAASAFGYTTFALQCPECGESVGMTAQCFTGYGVQLGTGVYTLKPDSECKGETWSPSAYGDTFTYNGGNYSNAVYTLTPPSPTTAAPGPTPAPYTTPVPTGTPAPTTPAPTGTPAPTTPATYVYSDSTISISSYAGCYRDCDAPGRVFMNYTENYNPLQCAQTAKNNGYSVFALEFPGDLLSERPRSVWTCLFVAHSHCCPCHIHMPCPVLCQMHSL